jgi:hypothetical protein
MKTEQLAASAAGSGYIGLDVACWPLVPKLAGLHPAKAVGFLGQKNPQHAFLRRGSKSRHLGKIYRTFLAHSSTFRPWVLLRGNAWWRKLERLTQIAQ